MKEDETDSLVIIVIDGLKYFKYLCRDYVMNGLADSLHNVYSAKKLWKSLDQKYKTEDASAKKFVVGRFLNFQLPTPKL